MRTVVCKRCTAVVPKHSTRQSKIFGGRICPACDEYMGELMTRSMIEKPVVAPRIPFPDTMKAKLYDRIRNKISGFFRRRGVQ